MRASARPEPVPSPLTMEAQCTVVVPSLVEQIPMASGQSLHWGENAAGVIGSDIVADDNIDVGVAGSGTLELTTASLRKQQMMFT